MAGPKRIISKDSPDYRAWSPPQVGGKGGAARPALRPPTAGDMESLQQAVREEAWREGHAAGEARGYQEGLRRAEEERAEQKKRLEPLLESMAAPFEDLDERVVEALVSLAVSVARHIIRRELRADPEQVIAVVREAVAALPDAAPRVEIHLHPDDAALVRDIAGVGEADSSWNIVEQPMITRGGCRVSSDASHIDATIERRVAEAVAHIMGEERLRQGGGGSEP